jgi:hypothetical protein
MAPRLEELHSPLDHRAARPATTGARRRRRGHTTSARDDRAGHQPTKPAVPERRPPPSADRGLILFVVFTASALTIVALVVLIAAIGSWWTLIPVMAVDFAVTAAVLITVAKLLEDSDAR